MISADDASALLSFVMLPFCFLQIRSSRSYLDNFLLRVSTYLSHVLFLK